MKILKKSIFALNIVFALGLMLAYASPYYDPNEYWIFSMFGLFYPILLLTNLFMILFWLLVEFKYLFLSLVVILLGWSHLQGFVNFSAKNDEVGELKLMSYNLGFSYALRSGSKIEKEQKKAELTVFFSDNEDVDVFCLQESSNYSRDILKSIYPSYHAHEVENRGTFIFSKYAVIRHGEIEFGTSTNSCLWADLKVKEDTIRIYNMHLQSNRVSKDAVDIIDNVNLQEKKTWRGIRGILGKYNDTSRTRAKQARTVSAHAAKSEHATIICGDGNDPPTSYTYSRLCGDYQDSFVEAGSGIGTTYAGKIPMLRIDYIFVDNSFDVNGFKVLKNEFSDHYAVKGVYKFRREGQ